MKSLTRHSIILVCLLLASLFFFGQCGQKPRSLGSVDRVIVLADSDLWSRVESATRAAIEREKYTPQPEKMIHLVIQEPGAIGGLKRYPHILFLGTLDSQGDTQQIVDQLLTPESRVRVEQDSSFLFQRQDAWSRGQLLLAVIARDVDTLVKRLEENSDVLFDVINDHANSIVEKSLYASHEQFDLEEQMLDSQGFRVRVQHDYFIAVDSLDERFLWLRRIGMEGDQRNLAVYWEPCDDPSLLSREWMVENRNRLAANYFGGDVIYQDDTIRIEETDVEFNGLFAVCLDGVWQNDEYAVGGPFRSYGFFSPYDNRLYLVDFHVLRPGERKWPFMRQLDAMARTFRTQSQLEE